MKLLIILSLLFATQAFAKPVHIVSKGAGIDITTEKVVMLQDAITPITDLMYRVQMKLTHHLSGPRVVVITSPGGIVENGQHMIDMMEEERKEGIQQICVAVDDAHSAAFNLLSHCDVRLATEGSTFVVHKIAISGMLGSDGVRATAKHLREIADEMDKADEPFRQFNAKAMGLPLPAYDKLADAETRWSVPDLLDMKYLAGVAEVL